MTVTPVSIEAFMITDAPGLDAIHAFWMDVAPGAGYVTVICYGSAWTAYFGAMGGRTIRQFIADVDVDYLVTRMGLTPQLKATKRDLTYLSKIISAVKLALKQASVCDRPTP